MRKPKEKSNSNSIVPFNKPFIVGDEIDYISKSITENCQLSGNGPYTKKCHNWLENELGTYKAFMTHSCTAALEMAAMVLNIQPGDEIIMPSYTFVSTANAFVLRGGVPVFVDISPHDLNINSELIERAVTTKTKAIVPVHYGGVPCDMDRILQISEKYKLYVIEDAAQAMLTMHKNKPLGSIGHFGCLSFHETKNIISGEGGAVLVNDKQFLERARVVWEKGTNRTAFLNGEVDKYTWQDIGSSFYPSDLVSAFLFGQLENAQKIIEDRRKTYQRYCERLDTLKDKIKLPDGRNLEESNGHLFYVLASSKDERDALINHMKGNGIHAIFHFVPLHSSPAGKKYCKVSGSMTYTDEVSETIVRLPLYYNMTSDEVDQVCDALIQFFR